MILLKILLGLIIEIIILFILMYSHKLLLKLIWYRWLINSIIYPVKKYRLKRKIKKSNPDEVNIMYLNLDMTKRWFDDYWFAKRLKHIISEAVEKMKPGNIGVCSQGIATGIRSNEC